MTHTDSEPPRQPGRPRLLNIPPGTPPARTRLAETLQLYLPAEYTFTAIAEAAYTSTSSVSRTFRAQSVPIWDPFEGIVGYLRAHYERGEGQPRFPSRREWFDLWAAAVVENGGKPHELPKAKPTLGVAVGASSRREDPLNFAKIRLLFAVIVFLVGILTATWVGLLVIVMRGKIDPSAIVTILSMTVSAVVAVLAMNHHRNVFQWMRRARRRENDE
jgi:hypothetical protein